MGLSVAASRRQGHRRDCPLKPPQANSGALIKREWLPTVPRCPARGGKEGWETTRAADGDDCELDAD